MKILAIGDPHGKLPKNIDRIIKKNRIEAIVCIGEVFPIFRNKDGSGNADLKRGEEIIKRISSFRIPTIIFKGNMFNIKGKSYFSRLLRKYGLNYKEIGLTKIKGKDFILFDMIFEPWAYTHLDKKFVAEVSKNNPIREKKLDVLLKKNKEAVLLSHAPPYGYVDKIHSGKHIGSKVLLRAIKKHHPKLVLCGHIHEAKGEAKIGKTKVINLGCCGDYKIIDI